MQRIFNFAATIFCALIVAIIYHANTDGSMAAMAAVRSIQHGDKYAHFFLFGMLGFLLNLAFRCKTWRCRRLVCYRGTGLVLLFAVAEEFSQQFLSRRMFDLHDLLADVVGVLFFTLITYYVHRSMAHQFNGTVK